MPSKARQTLAANKDDLDRLWEFHEQEAGSTRGRKYNVDVLNRAAVVMVCAAWEAYCEDIVREAIQYIVADCTDFNLLPSVLMTTVAERVKEDKHQHGVWKLAGVGWKQEVTNNALAVIDNLTGHWNTPKSDPIKKLFAKALGIPDITQNWHWAKNPAADTTKKLDGFVSLRGEIAHRLKTGDSVHKKDGTDFYDLASRLAQIVDVDVHAVLKAATTITYW